MGHDPNEDVHTDAYQVLDELSFKSPSWISCFHLDSVITAVGMAKHLGVMVFRNNCCGDRDAIICRKSQQICRRKPNRQNAGAQLFDI